MMRLSKPVKTSLLLAWVVLLGCSSPGFAKEYSKWNPMRYFQLSSPEEKSPETRSAEDKSAVKKSSQKSNEEFEADAKATDRENAAEEESEIKTKKNKKAKKPERTESRAVKREQEERRRAEAEEIGPRRETERDGDPQAKTLGALIETERGNIAIELYPEAAPVTVENFTKLVRENFYNVTTMRFHRVVPGFVVQTGDPTGTGAGGSRRTIPLEVKNKLSHNAKGVVAMARGLDPNSASSQFYITLTPQTSLDGKYAIFGRVISGLDVLDRIHKDDKVYGVKLIDASSIQRDPELDRNPWKDSLKGIFTGKSAQKQ